MKDLIKFLLGFAAVVAAVLGLIKYFYVDIVEVHDDRMAPTMIAGERVMLWRNASPELGDVVICAHPNGSGDLVMGRVVGTADEQLSAVRGNVAVDRHLLDRNWIGTFSYVDPDTGLSSDYRYGTETIGADDDHAFMAREGFVFTVRAFRYMDGDIFLLNDNRNQTTLDSRAYGLVDSATCIGQVFMRLSTAEGRQRDEPLDHGRLDILE